MAAWLGLVPRQVTTGGKPRLIGITKRGNKYLRKLLIHGARAALPWVANSATHLGEWLRALLARAHKNTAVVALANKLARIAWAVLRTGGFMALPDVRRAHEFDPVRSRIELCGDETGSLRVVEARWPTVEPAFRKPVLKNGIVSCRGFYEEPERADLHLGRGNADGPYTLTQTGAGQIDEAACNGAGHTFLKLRFSACTKAHMVR